MSYPLEVLDERCTCGCVNGRLKENGPHVQLVCDQCGRHVKFVSRVDAGLKPRTVSTTHAAIKPSQRIRIIERAGGVCESCRRRPCDKGLHVGHVVSVKAGIDFGLPTDVINSDENLIAQCDECNLGANKRTLPLHLYVSILRARVEWTQSNSETQQHG